MHVRLSQSLISMSIQKLYTNRSSFAQSARFRDRVLHFQLWPTYARKDNSVLVPDPLLSICRSETQITSTSLLILENVPFSN